MLLGELRDESSRSVFCDGCLTGLGVPYYCVSVVGNRLLVLRLVIWSTSGHVQDNQ